MTNPFASQAYIAYCREHPLDWEPKVGDWCFSTRAEYLGLVVRMPMERDDGSHRTSWAILHPAGSGVFRTRLDDWAKDEWVWLPTLGQLVRMLRDAKETFTIWGPDEYDPDDPDWVFDGDLGNRHKADDPELAARKLLDAVAK